MNKIREAITYFGGQTAFARAVGATPGQVHMLLKRNSKLPDVLAIRLESRSDGVLPLTEFRPDIAEALREAGYVRSASSERPAPTTPPIEV